MIIKTFSRISPNISDIIQYIADQDKQPQKPLSIHHNLYSSNLDDITNAFESNLKYQTAQNRVTAYHNILSWSPKDQDVITRKAIYQLTQRYIQLRAPKSLWFGRLHSDQEHPHVHLLFSGNQLMSKKASSIRQSDFYHIRSQLEDYQKKHFPQLIHSLHYGHFRDYPQRFLAHKLHPVYEQAQTKADFYQLAQNMLDSRARIDPHTMTAHYLGQTYPLADLGIDLQLFDRLQSLDKVQQKKHHRTYERNILSS